MWENLVNLIVFFFILGFLMFGFVFYFNLGLLMWGIWTIGKYSVNMVSCNTYEANTN